MVDYYNKYVAVMLDVSKEFNKVWHKGLLDKLSDFLYRGGGAAVQLICSYHAGRFFMTSVDGELSTLRPILVGVFQGSVLEPVLYLVFINGFPAVPGVVPMIRCYIMALQILHTLQELCREAFRYDVFMVGEMAHQE